MGANQKLTNEMALKLSQSSLRLLVLAVTPRDLCLALSAPTRCAVSVVRLIIRFLRTVRLQASFGRPSVPFFLGYSTESNSGQ